MRWFLITLLIAPTFALANVENAGIVDGIWLSHATPVENQPVRIYVAVHNNTAGDLEGTVHFRVNDDLLDTMRINALDGRIVEGWADWVPQAGTNTITVSLRRTELISTASGTQPVDVVTPLTERTIFIDTDTDGDLVGNQEDADDDNDGATDEEERAAGTDPLVYDEPPPEPVAEESPFARATTTPNNAAASEQAGLEALVEPGTARNVLERSTNVIKQTKNNLDDYRIDRHEITRSMPDTESESGFGTMVIKLLSGIYSAFLAILSWLLGYPGLVQLLLLLLLLYLLYRLIRRYGRRPDY